MRSASACVDFEINTPYGTHSYRFTLTRAFMFTVVIGIAISENEMREKKWNPTTKWQENHFSSDFGRKSIFKSKSRKKNEKPSICSCLKRKYLRSSFIIWWLARDYVASGYARMWRTWLWICIFFVNFFPLCFSLTHKWMRTPINSIYSSILAHRTKRNRLISVRQCMFASCVYFRRFSLLHSHFHSLPFTRSRTVFSIVVGIVCAYCSQYPHRRWENRTCRTQLFT